MISKVQKNVAAGKDFRLLDRDALPPYLKDARLHVEVIVGIGDRDRIGRLVSGRNTSRQVKSWSLAEFDGTFDWIRRRSLGATPFLPRCGQLGRRIFLPPLKR